MGQQLPVTDSHRHFRFTRRAQEVPIKRPPALDGLLIQNRQEACSIDDAIRRRINPGNLGSQDRVQREGGNIDVFGAMLQLEVPLLLRPLKGLLGAYLRDPAAGVLSLRRRAGMVPPTRAGSHTCASDPCAGGTTSRTSVDRCSAPFYGAEPELSQGHPSPRHLDAVRRLWTTRERGGKASPG